MIHKPDSPMIRKIVYEATVGDNSAIRGIEKDVLDREDIDDVEYQIELKQYKSDKKIYKENLQKCFTIIMGQCSPSMERALESEVMCKDMKEKSDSISLIKLLERICYSY